GKRMIDLWTDIERIGNTSRERLGYPTQKPEALLERILKSSSNEGDVVLDAYCGCGTTVAVSQRLNRQWIGIDITYQSISLILKRLEDSFGKGVLDNITLNGIPKDMKSAEALANKSDDRTRKEFEKWAVLTYSNNRATINQKKGADKGIDGIAYYRSEKDDPEKIILQVKSGKVKSGDIRDLQGTMTRESAVLGVFITLQKPTKDMLKEAKEAGIYQSQYMSAPVDKIRIVTVQE
ncbi:MAG: DNA methyltransferase, partial [Pseudanabaena sp.]